jgi:hypothetical protein
LNESKYKNIPAHELSIASIGIISKKNITSINQEILKSQQVKNEIMKSQYVKSFKSPIVMIQGEDSPSPLGSPNLKAQQMDTSPLINLE